MSDSVGIAKAEIDRAQAALITSDMPDARALLHANLHEVFSERDPDARWAAIERTYGADVRTFRRLDRANAAVMRRMHVTDFEARAIAANPPGPSAERRRLCVTPPAD